MNRFALAAIICATATQAAEHPSRIEAIGHGDDSLEIVADGPHRATVRYTNSAKSTSAPGHFIIQIGTIIVDVQIDIGGVADGSKEHATITPRGQFISIPPDGWATDGETISFLIVPAMF